MRTPDGHISVEPQHSHQQQPNLHQTLPTPLTETGEMRTCPRPGTSHKCTGASPPHRLLRLHARLYSRFGYSYIPPPPTPHWDPAACTSSQCLVRPRAVSADVAPELDAPHPSLQALGIRRSVQVHSGGKAPESKRFAKLRLRLVPPITSSASAGLARLLGGPLTHPCAHDPSPNGGEIQPGGRGGRQRPDTSCEVDLSSSGPTSHSPHGPVRHPSAGFREGRSAGLAPP
jgi:hypothetical protein